MRRRERPLPLRRFVVLAAASLFGAACERHVEEPLRPIAPAPTRSTEATAGAVKQPGNEVAPAPAPAPVRAAAPADPLAGRCVRPTPETPSRPTPRSPDPRCPRDPETPPKLRAATVTFPEAKGIAVSVEVAETDDQRRRGLMYRKAMPANRGMIFAFERKENHAFWMHNTCIPLDMLYLDDDGLIVGIQENTPTISDDTFEVGCPSKYVLEVNAGWTRAHGVKAGQRVKLDGV